MLVATGSPVATVADLRGRKVAAGRGRNVQFMLVQALAEAGLGWGDIEPVYVTNAAGARAAFRSQRVDAVGLWDPFLASAELTDAPSVLRDGKGSSASRTFHVGSPTFIATQPDLLRAGVRRAASLARLGAGEPG